MASVIVPFSASAIALAEMLERSSNCRYRTGIDPTSGARVLILEGNPGLVVPRECWNEAFGVPLEPYRDASEWDQEWRAWPLRIEGQIARFDEWVLVVSGATPVKGSKSES
jgi:hypothetical protein